jgi:hypothetical protein
MNACSFSQLLPFVNRQLDLEGYLKVCDHLKSCDICRDAVHQLSQDRDESAYINRTHGRKPSLVRDPINAGQRPLGA